MKVWTLFFIYTRGKGKMKGYPRVKKRKNPAANRKLAAGKLKHSENSRKKLKIPLKNCKTGRQGRENAHQAAQQKSPADLKWLDISIKRTWKIGHRLRWFCAIQQRKEPVTFFMSQAFGAPEGIRTPGTWRRRPVLYPAELQTQMYEIIGENRSISNSGQFVVWLPLTTAFLRT